MNLIVHSCPNACFSQNFTIIQAAWFIFNGSQLLQVCKDVSVFQMEGSIREEDIALGTAYLQICATKIPSEICMHTKVQEKFSKQKTLTLNSVRRLLEQWRIASEIFAR